MGEAIFTRWCRHAWLLLVCGGAATAMAALTSAQPIAHWPAEASAVDVIGAHHGTLHNSTTFAVGVSGQAFSLNGVND